MPIKINKLPESTIEIEGQIDWLDFQMHRAEALKNLGKDLELPGFRKGHVPENILIKNIPEMRILEEMAELAMPKAYLHILEENKIDAIGRPEISIIKLVRDNPLGFKIKTAVLPGVKLPDYKALAAEMNKNKPEKTELSEEEKIKTKEKQRIKIIDAVLEKTKIELPRILVDSQLEKMLYQVKGDIEKSGFKFEDYLKHLNKTEEDMKKEWEKEGEKRSKLELILHAIAKQENIKAEENEIKSEVEKLMEMYKDADPIRARAYVENILQNEKIWQFLENQ